MVMFCLKKDAEPFMVAEVCSVDVENKSLCVNWWTPTSLSRQKQQLFHNTTHQKQNSGRSNVEVEPKNSDNPVQHGLLFIQ